MEKYTSKRKDMFQVKLEQLIAPKENNIRQDYGDLQELADSIKEHGVKVPLRGVKTRGEETYVVTDGFRRYHAAQLAMEQVEDLELWIPILKEDTDFNEEARLTNMIVCNEGKPFNIIEQGIVFDKLRELGLANEEIAQKVGKSRTHVADCLLLFDAPEEIKKRVVSGEVAASLVIKELKVSTAEQVGNALDKAIEENNGKKVTQKSLKEKDSSPKISAEQLTQLYSKLEAEEAEQNSSEFCAPVTLNPISMGILHGLIQYINKDKDFEELFELFKLEENAIQED